MSTAAYCDASLDEHGFAVLKGCLETRNIALRELEAGKKAAEGTVGVLFWAGEHAAFFNELEHLWNAGIRQFTVYSPLLDADSLWVGMADEHRRVIERACGDIPTNLGVLAASIPSQQPEPWLNRRIGEIVTARAVHELVKSFGHGSGDDIANQFLAPARLLALAGGSPGDKDAAEWKKVWGKFKLGVIGEIEKAEWIRSDWSDELCALSEPISAWAAGPSKAFPSASDYDGLLTFLTRIRLAAAGESRASYSYSGKRPEVEALRSSDPGKFQVLVIDDHAASWRPVFANLQRDMTDKGIEAEFEFSVTGKRVDGQGATAIQYSSYDLIVLDVFLGNDTGTTILKELRKSFPHLPVLLWTTSRDEEVTSEAARANGILLKKSVSWHTFVSSVSTWIQYGKAMRIATLPNPFFNHAILNIEYRQLAVAFHEWCLKQLDSFHALDSEYFRYFTDHGGRHIVKLWELMEQALQPFLHEDESLLSRDKEERESEIFVIYLAIICHELGMFPMKIGKNVENFARLGRDYLNDVRGLHAVRGMALLADKSDRFWNDLAGQKLGMQLRKFDGMTERLAVLVGYHARLFKSLDEENFLNPDAARKTLQEKLDGLSSPWPALGREDTVFGPIFDELAKQFQGQAKRERLRRQCALFRFVDALDITSSRNPADFLIGSDTLRPQQYGENLKRELCKDAGIKAGKVYAKMRAAAPDFGVVEMILKFVEGADLLKGEIGKEAFGMIDEEKASELINNPWGSPKCEPLTAATAASLQKALDSWLAEVWKVLVLQDGETAFLDHLKHQVGLLDKTSHKPRLVFAGAKILTSLTSLSVAAELLDEYAAIVDAGMTHKIALPRATSGETLGFQWGENWDEVPADLITLLKVLPSNERKSGQTGGYKSG